MISNSDVLDTSFRSSLERMISNGRLQAYTAPIDPNLSVAGVLKKQDGGPALLFTSVNGYDVPVIGNLLCCQLNCEAAFGLDFRGIRDAVGRALATRSRPSWLKGGAPKKTYIPIRSTCNVCCRFFSYRGGCRTVYHRGRRHRS